MFVLYAVRLKKRVKLVDVGLEMPVCRRRSWAMPQRMKAMALTIAGTVLLAGCCSTVQRRGPTIPLQMPTSVMATNVKAGLQPLPAVSDPGTLRELLDQLKIRYETIRNQLNSGRLNGVPEAAREMAAYARLVPEFISELSPEEQARVASLAQALELHALEVHQASSVGDLSGSRKHLKHVLWVSYRALRSGLRKALGDPA